MRKSRWSLWELWPVCGGVVIYLLLDLRCPVLCLFGIPCPTCGVTRALGALLRLDIAGYLRYNWMALFLVSAVLLYLYRDCFCRRGAITAYTMAVLGLNSMRYIFLLAARPLFA